MIIASTEADPSIRAVAVRKLFDTLSNPELNSIERVSMRDFFATRKLTFGLQAETEAGLRARVVDTNTQVLAALYSNPSALLPILDESFLDQVIQLLCSAQASPSRQLVRAHLTFITHHFVSKFPSLAGKVFSDCLWPFLIYSKPRQKTAAAVWEVLESTDCCEEISKYEILGGCVDAVRWEEGKDQPLPEGGDGDANVMKMARVDIALASKIAENVLSSNNYSTQFETLLRKLVDPNSFSRTTGYLVMRALLGRLSGEHQIDAAHRVLEVMNLEDLNGLDDFMRGSQNLQAVSR